MREAIQFITCTDDTLVAVAHVVSIKPVTAKCEPGQRRKATLSLTNGETATANIPLHICALPSSVVPGHQSEAVALAPREWERRSVVDEEGAPEPVRLHLPRSKPDYS